MGVWIWKDKNLNRAGFMQSTSEWAFGPVFSGDDEFSAAEDAQLFLDFLDSKGIQICFTEDSQLESLKAAFDPFLKTCECGERIYIRDKCGMCEEYNRDAKQQDFSADHL